MITKSPAPAAMAPPSAGPNPGDGSPSPWSAAGDVPALLLLMAICLLAWCAANAKWTLADWRLPTTYLEPEHADFVGTCAGVKAVTEGNLMPWSWKSVPALGAPFEANWNDNPMVEDLQFAFFGLLARLFGLFAAFNLGALIGNLSAAGVFYPVARLSGCNRTWAFVSALAFGLAPFIFAQSPYHITCEWVWQVPLFLPVWRWAATDPGILPRTTKWWRTVGIGFVTGLQNPYFTNIFCQLSLLSGAIQYVRNRSRPAFLGAFTAVAAAAFAFALMNVDTWSYRLLHEPNPGSMSREYKWLEIYGLKLVDLFIPPLTHRSTLFAAFSADHRQNAVLLDEGASYQGLIGAACLLWLVATAVAAVIHRREGKVPLEAWQVLWIVLMFTTGGLNAIVGSFSGFTLFRGGCRYSVVILAISLLFAARRLSVIQESSVSRDTDPARGRLWTGLAAGLCMLVLWDQVPRAPSQEKIATIARDVQGDREFVAKMEAALPKGAMVFQLPIMEYPEAPAPGVPPYDHLRPYLYSTGLRYSFGSIKGRPREEWQKELTRVPLRDAIDEILKRGFKAVYFNRNGFPDRAKGFEQSLLEMGYSKPPIRNAAGDLACIVLEKD